MIQATQIDDIYAIKFPYNTDIIALVKNVPGRMWHPESKYWSIPRDKIGFLKREIDSSDYAGQLQIQSNEHIDENASLDATTAAAIPDIDVSNIHYYIGKGLKPFKHQIDSLKFDIDRKRHGRRSGFMLCDEMGVSKTAQVINIALYNKNYEGAKHCLIICCVNSAKYTWIEEIKKHTQGEFEGYIIGSRLKRDGSINYVGSRKDKYDDLTCNNMYGSKAKEKKELPYFLILNIESLLYKEGRTFALTKKLIEMINKGELNTIALDEVHKGVSPTAQQGQQILAIKKNIQRQIEWIPMTGTPIVNKPTDVFLPLRLVDGHYCNSYYKWNQEFCIYGGYGGYEIIGYKNIPKLKSMLQPNMLRRLKKDVLDLPPKMYIDEFVENTEYQVRLYNNVVAGMIASKGIIQKAIDPLSKFIKLRQVNGYPEAVDTDLQIDDHYLAKNAKLARLLDLVDEIIENDQKVIIFSNWVVPLRTIYTLLNKRYKKQGIITCVYTGTMDQATRENQKTLFITRPDCKILLGTVGALGVSHNLSVARNVIFYDEPWSKAAKEQACDRVYRADTKESVTIYTLITKDTVDEHVHNIIFKKEGQSDYIVDDELDLKKHPELLDLLLTKNK